MSDQDNVVSLGGGGIPTSAGENPQRGGQEDEGFDTAHDSTQVSAASFLLSSELEAVDGIAILRVRHRGDPDPDNTAIVSVPLLGALAADEALGFLTYAQTVIDESIRAGEREQRAAQMQAMMQQQQMQGNKNLLIPR